MFSSIFAKYSLISLSLQEDRVQEGGDQKTILSTLHTLKHSQPPEAGTADLHTQQLLDRVYTQILVLVNI